MSTDERFDVELADRFRRDLGGIPIPPEERWIPGAGRPSRFRQLVLWVPLAAVIVIAGLIVGVELRGRHLVQFPVANPPTPSATATPTPTSTPSRAARTSPDVANVALASRARDTGRSDVVVCLYVDSASGVADTNAALGLLQSSIDSLVRQGYTVLGTRPASWCTETPFFIRTGTVHPKNSANGPVAGTPPVTQPSEFILFVAVTSPARIDTIFGRLSLHRGTEEYTCRQDNCFPVTESIYVDPNSFANDSERERLVLEGFGLLPQ